ncbi:copper-containing nitrite reductase [Neoaquamicrobium sediminum]|uniref:copper-containing nitrite reductase n=1 Tax=Neoaquamicrobium sediminum TaxID=1849104 RepID=UPI0036133FD5
MSPKQTTSGSDQSAEEDKSISRRRLLVGSVGAVGGLVAAEAALAQTAGAHSAHKGGAPADGTQMAQHRTYPGSLSNRIYSINPVHPDMADIAEKPTNIPPPLTRREPATVRVDLETKEIEAHLDDKAMFRFWTFNGTVPGPFVRVRVGDQVEVHLKNPEDSWMMHNVDFHACTGPGGGAGATTAAPGEERSFTFKALNPGLYVYHCAVPPVALHIANGMYGLILVEPEDGLPPVDREFYVMQGEIYTEEPFGSSGLLTESYDKLLNERPEYFVFNGHVGALTDHYPLKAQVGETVRIFFGVGGPNYTSGFHVIGEIFDKAYQLGSVTSPPITDVQSISVPPGSANIVEFKCEVPGRYVLVDHALSRAERGLAGYLIVEGPDNPDVFNAPPNPHDSGH